MKSVPAISLLLCIAVMAQMPATKTYSSDNFGFELAYPASYRKTHLPSRIAQWAFYRGARSLLYVSSGTGQETGSIHVLLDKRRFTEANVQSNYAHTGWEKPQEVRVGKNMFYYYGPGGGGVSYPDDYFYNLTGQILVISFDGPYEPIGARSPSEKTKLIESKVLESLRLLKTATNE